MPSIRKALLDNWKVMRGGIRSSRAAFSSRALTDLMELVPNLFFFATQAVTVFLLFKVINGVESDFGSLLIFIGILICVDACGDSLFLPGLLEYCSSLLRGQTVYYLMTPGAPLAKVFFFRADLLQFGFGATVGLTTAVASWLKFGANPFTVLGLMGVGVFMHMTLTSAFSIIQAHFDPTRPIRLGSPATRFYTRPIHLVLQNSVVQTILIFVYPAYFVTAFPAIIATGWVPPDLLLPPGVVFLGGIVSLVLWAVGLNALMKRSCIKYQN